MLSPCTRGRSMSPGLQSAATRPASAITRADTRWVDACRLGIVTTDRSGQILIAALSDLSGQRAGSNALQSDAAACGARSPKDGSDSEDRPAATAERGRGTHPEADSTTRLSLFSDQLRALPDEVTRPWPIRASERTPQQSPSFKPVPLPDQNRELDWALRMEMQ